MRIILDTDKGRIILPKAFFSTMDKMNKILAEGGSDKKWTAEDYVRDQFEGDGFDIDYSSLSSYKYFNYLTTTIAWLIEDGQAIYGNISLKQGELTVTLVDGGIYIDTDVHEELNGTYLKQ